MKAGRKVLSVLAVLVVLVLVALVSVFIFIDSIARKGIETGATFALGVPTTLQTADVGVLGGTFSMAGLEVDNPQGFKTPDFFTLGTGRVAVSLGSLTKDTVELPLVELADINVSLERGSAGTNYGIILNNLKKLESGGSTPPGKEPGKKFIIREVIIRNVTVRADLIGAPGALTAVTLPIPEIRLTNVGQGQGVNLGELTNIIIQAVLASAAQVGGGIIPDDVLGELKGGLGQLKGLGQVGVEAIGKVGEQAKKITEGLDTAAKDAAKKLEDTAKNTTDSLKRGIGDLIPGSKDKK